MFEIKNNKSIFSFGIINKFYCRIFLSSNKDLLLISDFKHFFICEDSSKFCSFCFEYDYINYVTKEELIGNFQKQEINELNLNGFMNEDIFRFLNKIYSKKLRFKENEWLVYNLAQRGIDRSFKQNLHPLCSTCNKDKILNFSASNMEKFISAKELAFKNFYSDLHSPKFSRKFLNSKIHELLLLSKGLISYFDTFKLNDLGFNHYFASLLSSIPNEKGDIKPLLSLGQDKKSIIAKIKALMEFIERYALKNKIIYPCAINIKTSDALKNFEDIKLCSKDMESESQMILAPAIDMLNDKSIMLRVGSDKLDYAESSNGIGAHLNLKDAATNSLLELIERDGFVRWWTCPENFSAIKPRGHLLRLINNFKKFAFEKIKNDSLEVRVLLLPSPLSVPVIISLLTSKNQSMPPALMVGAAASFNINEAIEKSLFELYGNFLNVVCRMGNEPDFFKKSLDTESFDTIKSPADHGSFYHHPGLIKDLKFLPNILSAPQVEINSVTRGDTFDLLKQSLSSRGMEWYLLDMTPSNLKQCGIFVVKSFVPELNSIIFGQNSMKYFDSAEVSKLSVAKKLPHPFA